MAPSYNPETVEQDVWLEFEKRACTEEDRRQISVLVIVLALLRGFLTITEGLRGRTPRAVLAELNNSRSWARQYPDVLTESLRRYWDRLEQELYEHILPEEVRQAAVDGIPCHGSTWAAMLRESIASGGKNTEAMAGMQAVVTPEGRRRFQQDYLSQLRAQLTDSRVTPLLDQVIGKRETRGRVKLKSASIKNWPLVADAILVVYEILWPMYTRASAPQPGSAVEFMQDDPPAYPQTLLNHIAKLFNMEFPEYLSDLSAHDVLSRVQYRIQGAAGSTRF